jgi:hypothetical protein
MTPEQITAIAREYAEEATKVDASDPNLSASDLNGIKNDVAEYAVEIIRWLSNRYCLVEKSDVKPYCKSLQNILAHQERYDVYIVREAEVEMKMFRYFYPEIAKEVEE